MKKESVRRGENNKKMSDARLKDRASLICYLNRFSLDILEEHSTQQLNYIRCDNYYIPDILSISLIHYPN